MAHGRFHSVISCFSFSSYYFLSTHNGELLPVTSGYMKLYNKMASQCHKLEFSAAPARWVGKKNLGKIKGECAYFTTWKSVYCGICERSCGSRLGCTNYDKCPLRLQAWKCKNSFFVLVGGVGKKGADHADLCGPLLKPSLKHFDSDTF